jgi:hypothetical protein
LEASRSGTGTPLRIVQFGWPSRWSIAATANVAHSELLPGSILAISEVAAKLQRSAGVSIRL